jgi:hypothetical protein
MFMPNDIDLPVGFYLHGSQLRERDFVILFQDLTENGIV